MSHLAVADQKGAAAMAPAFSIRQEIVSLSQITKSFGPTLANAEIDLAVSAGEIIGLVGGNGEMGHSSSVSSRPRIGRHPASDPLCWSRYLLSRFCLTQSSE